MTNKDWPKDGSPAYFGDLVEQVLNALNVAYKLERQNTDLDLPWEGFDRSREDMAACRPLADTLSAEGLAFSLEDQGREAIEEIIGAAIALGMEQGKRVLLRDMRLRMTTLHMFVRTAQRDLFNIENQLDALTER